MRTTWRLRYGYAVFPVLASPKNVLRAQRFSVSADPNERWHTPGANSIQIAHFKPAILEPDRNSDLAAIGHGLELLAFFPRFLLVPWDGGSAMIVWIADQGGLFLRCA